MKNTTTAAKIKAAADGPIYDGGGLILFKKGAAGKWVYRYSRLKLRRDMGLGAWPEVTLAEARKLRDGWAAELAAGHDPLTLREEQRAAEMADRDRDDPTFDTLVQIVFDAKRAGLRGDGTRGRWLSPLQTHLSPRIGRRRVSELTRHDIADALRPIWRTKYPTAEKCYQRARKVLFEGQLMGYPCDPVIVDAATRILGEVHHVTTPIPSTPWQDIPALFAKLGESSVDRCLKFMILTLVRTDGCAGARRDEVEGDIWTVPADRIKGTVRRVKDFRVPLSPPALAIVNAEAMVDSPLLFPTWTGRAPTSTALEKRLTVLGEAGRPHGFRTSFRTWVQDTDACSWDVSETVLGHAIGNKTERSYARSDLLERRRVAMIAWANYVTGAASNVVGIRQGA